MKAKEIMTAPVVTVTEGTPVSEVAAVLHGGRISAVPVLDAAGAVMGLVSEDDLLARPGATPRTRSWTPPASPHITTAARPLLT